MKVYELIHTVKYEGTTSLGLFLCFTNAFNALQESLKEEKRLGYIYKRTKHDPYTFVYKDMSYQINSREVKD